MKDRVERTILSNLLHNEDYLRKVIPFIKADYFEEKKERIIYEEISDFISKYDKRASQEILSIEVKNRSDLNETEYREVQQVIDGCVEEEINQEWLSDTTEKWCKDRAIYLALMESIGIAVVVTRRRIGMLFHLSCKKHLQFVLTTTLDTIT